MPCRKFDNLLSNGVMEKECSHLGNPGGLYGDWVKLNVKLYSAPRRDVPHFCNVPTAVIQKNVELQYMQSKWCYPYIREELSAGKRESEGSKYQKCVREEINEEVGNTPFLSS